MLSIAAQAAYQLRYESTEYYSLVGSGPKCFQVLGLSPNLLQNPWRQLFIESILEL